MKHILNLVNQEQSEIEYKKIRYPDGQQSIVISGEQRKLLPDNACEFFVIDKFKDIDNVIIMSRMNNFLDLELIICANQALKGVGVKSVSLYVPYFLGGRSDRKFEFRGVNYLKNVISPIINNQWFDEVYSLDPHSDVLGFCVNNFNARHPARISDIDHENKFDSLRCFFCDNIEICIVAPDAGSYKKVLKFYKSIKNYPTMWKNLKISFMVADKERDYDGSVSIEIPTLNQSENTRYFVIDDICDGGRTFIELAKKIKEQRPNAELYLYVTHGIFSNGFEELNKYFNHIFTTNSVQELEQNKNLTQYKVF